MDEETSRKLIAGMTDALCEATTEGLREHTWVVVEGHSPKNWGVGGVPWDERGADADAAAARRPASSSSTGRRAAA